MHAGAVVIWDAYQKSPSSGFEWDHEAVRLGLGDPPPEKPVSARFGGPLSFRLHVALPPVFGLIAGLSIELQIKAIARLLDLENRKTHGIVDLSKYVGITLSSENAAFADALSEYIIWASRYPTPRNEAKFNKAYDTFRKAGFPAALGEPETLARYESLWTMYRSAYWRCRKVIDEP
jgi:hypothetical protein